MKAIGQLIGDAGIDGITELVVEQTALGEHDVLVEVYRLGLNPSDYRMCLPTPLPKSYPFIFGSDIAGVIKEVGNGVTRFRVGDAVYGKEQIPNFSGCKEFVTINQDLVSIKPEKISFEQAATIPVTFQTAYMNLVKKGGLKTGHSVLVMGGVGGVGSTAVQIAKDMGAKVYVTVLHSDVERAAALGADVIIDSENGKISDISERKDLVMDTLGLKFQAEAYPVMKDGATLVSCAETPDQELAGKYGVNASPFEFAIGNHIQLDIANEMIERDSYVPIYNETIEFSVDAIQDALHRIQKGYGVSVPLYRMKVEEVLNVWKISMSELVKGALNVQERTVLSNDDDVITLDIAAAREAL